MKAFRKIRSGFFILCAVELLATASLAAVPFWGDERQGPEGFEQVAEKGMPAVVALQFPRQRPQSQLSTPFGRRNPYDFFNEDFWNQLFGTPDAPTVIGQGSGFFVSPNGHILTNNHVVREAEQITAILHDGRELKAHIVGQDPSTDLAIVKVEGEDFPYLELGDSDALKVGQWVAAIGHPLGFRASLTAGVVSAKGRNNLDITHIEDFIQTDAAINRGNSGGPLLNMEGKAVGVNTALVGSLDGGYVGLGFAIPSNMAKHVMEQLIANGQVQRGFLGVQLQDVTPEIAEAMDLPSTEGALVADVVAQSPAEAAGIKQGDVIVSINGNRVVNMAALRTRVAMVNPNTDITLGILRNGEQITLRAKTALFPDALPATVDAPQELGVTVELLTPDMNYSGQKGVYISKVAPGSLGQVAGLQPGQLILSVNKQPVVTPAQFREAVSRGVQSGKPLILLVRHGSLTRFVSISVKG